MAAATAAASPAALAHTSRSAARNAAVCAGRLRREEMARPRTAARAGSASSGSSAGATPARRSSAANRKGALVIYCLGL